MDSTKRSVIDSTKSFSSLSFLSKPILQVEIAAVTQIKQILQKTNLFLDFAASRHQNRWRHLDRWRQSLKRDWIFRLRCSKTDHFWVKTENFTKFRNGICIEILKSTGKLLIFVEIVAIHCVLRQKNPKLHVFSCFIYMFLGYGFRRNDEIAQVAPILPLC